MRLRMDPQPRVCPSPCGLRRDSTDGLSRLYLLWDSVGLVVGSSLLQGIPAHTVRRLLSYSQFWFLSFELGFCSFTRR